jgi:hypothetical protein
VVDAGLLWQKGTAFSVCVCVSRSLVATQVQRGREEERPIFGAPSLTRANNSVSQVSAPHYRSSITSQLLVPVSRCWVGLINKQRFLEFWCRGLFCGVCVIFWDHPCYWFLELCFPRWVLVAESMGRRKLVGDWLTDWLTDLAWWGRIGCQDDGGFAGGRGL